MKIRVLYHLVCYQGKGFMCWNREPAEPGPPLIEKDEIPLLSDADIYLILSNTRLV